MQTVTTQSKRRIARPLGVLVITGFDGIFIGLVPLILLIVLDSDPHLPISQFDFYLTAALRIVVVAAALGALMGDNTGKQILLWAVTAVSVLMILSSFGFLSSDRDAGSQGADSIGNITRGIFWIAVNWWYFNRKGVVDYYRQNKDAQT